MGLFKRGKTRDELIAEAAELNTVPEQEEKKDDVVTGNPKIDIEFAKLRGQIDGLNEARKATGERFSRVSEQIGELRGMVVDTNKMMSKVEVSSTKAIDLVESVHPEKLMIEVRRQDGKVEALRANIESNEAIMKDLMLELKKMRDKMSFYKGIEQVIALNDEIKQELAMIKRVEGNVERHADKVETVFLEVEKKFAEFDKFNDTVKDLDKVFKKTQSDFEKIRVRVEMKLERKDFLDLLDKFNDFEKHTTNLLKLLDERNKTVKDELDAQFKGLEKEYRKKLDTLRPPSKPLPTPKEPKARPSEGPPPVGEGGAGETGSQPSGEDGAGSDAIAKGFGAKLRSFFLKESKS
jgi:hypothetical protein